MTDFKTAVLAMAKARPNEPVSLIVELALALEDYKDTAPNLDDAKALALWAERQPTVAAAIAKGKKINAIKELRTLTGSSLIQAKKAMDELMPPTDTGRTYNY